MDFEQLISNITPEIHTALRRAIEIGKWPNGQALSAEQKALCMEAVINYEHRFVNEQERVGFIDSGSKQEGELCDDSAASENDKPTPLKWS